jgi:uncharacterized membrane protein YuzA (DUF378 family)
MYCLVHRQFKTNVSPFQEENNMKSIDVLAAILLVVGGLNWGLVGLFQFDLVAALFGGQGAGLARVVYSLVGLAAIYQGLQWKAIQRRWVMSPVNA